jgi:hypothetical protein
MRTTILTPALMLLALASCGEITASPESKAVGAACTADAQCDQTCLVDERHFAGCPSGSVCLAEEGGVCVVSCLTDADCAGFGRGFVCDEDELQNGGGAASICRVP